MINIATMNFHLDGEGITNTQIDGRETLLDADLIIANPKEFSRVWQSHTNSTTIAYLSAEKVRNVFLTRSNELYTLLNNGKILVVFLSPITIINAQARSGSYNNNTISNYDFLPSDKDLLMALEAGSGTIPNSIKLSNPTHLFAAYFKAFSNELQYSAYLDIEVDDDAHYFLTNRSKKPVGFSVEVGKGLIVFIPPPKNIDHKKLVGTLIDCTKKYLTKKKITPTPDWINDFKLRGEVEFDEKIAGFDKKISDLLNQKKVVEEEMKVVLNYKRLLFESGAELEDVVIDFFRLIGFKAENRKLNDLEHDVIFESNEGKGIAEIEGKDNDSIHIGKLDQLNRAVDEDFELTDKYPQGILIGNHFRLLPPSDRKDPFTDKVLTVAKKKSFGLLTTHEIYKAVEKILENPDNESFKTSCRKKILESAGEIIELT